MSFHLFLRAFSHVFHPYCRCNFLAGGIGRHNDTEKASVFSDSEICANYELRLSRIIDILKEINPKPSDIKSILKPQLPEVKTIEDSALDETISYTEGLLGNIEKNILTYEQKLKYLDGRIEENNQNTAREVSKA